MHRARSFTTVTPLQALKEAHQLVRLFEFIAGEAAAESNLWTTYFIAG